MKSKWLSPYPWNLDPNKFSEGPFRLSFTEFLVTKFYVDTEKEGCGFKKTTKLSLF